MHCDRIHVTCTSLQVKGTMAKAARECLFCGKDILARDYRTVFSDHMVPLYGEIRNLIGVEPDPAVWKNTNLSKFVCRACFNRLNRLNKLEFELTHWNETLLDEKAKITALLSPGTAIVTQELPVPDASGHSHSGSQPSQRTASQPSQPTASHASGNGKRGLGTPGPTPKKVVKREPVSTPPTTALRRLLPGPRPDHPPQPEPKPGVWEPVPVALILNLPPKPHVDCQDRAAQVTLPQSNKQTPCASRPAVTDPPGTVKVTVTYPSQTKTRVVKEDVYKRLLRAMVDGASVETLAGTLYRDERHRHALDKLMCYRLSCDCGDLCSDKNLSLLQKKSTDDLISLEWDSVISEWRERSPLLYEVLEAISTKVHAPPKASQEVESRHLPRIGLAGSILLYSRNPKVCRVQLATGLTLDQGGATDESISVMQRMGVSVTPQALHQKRREMLDTYRELMKDTVGAFVKDR